MICSDKHTLDSFSQLHGFHSCKDTTLLQENNERIAFYLVYSKRYIFLVLFSAIKTFLSSCRDSAWFTITSKNTITLLKMLFIKLKS